LLTRALARQPQHAYIFANPRTGQRDTPAGPMETSMSWLDVRRAYRGVCTANDPARPLSTSSGVVWPPTMAHAQRDSNPCLVTVA
jgi:hypothetical protein